MALPIPLWLLYLAIIALSTLFSYRHFRGKIPAHGILGIVSGFGLGIILCLTIASYLAESLEYFSAFMAVILTWFAAASSWKSQP